MQETKWRSLSSGYMSDHRQVRLERNQAQHQRCQIDVFLLYLHLIEISLGHRRICVSFFLQCVWVSTCLSVQSNIIEITTELLLTFSFFVGFRCQLNDPVDITLFLPRLSVIHLQDSLLESFLQIVSSIQQQLSQKTVVKWMGVLFHHLQQFTTLVCGECGNQLDELTS